jgi:head-tail adaptor
MSANLRERVTFSEYTEEPNEYGGFELVWSDFYTCRAQFIYHSGGEDIQAARYQGNKVYKVKILSCASSRSITTDMRMTDARRGTVYNIREVDQITDPAFVYIVAESGVAA